MVLDKSGIHAYHLPVVMLMVMLMVMLVVMLVVVVVVVGLDFLSVSFTSHVVVWPRLECEHQ